MPFSRRGTRRGVSDTEHVITNDEFQGVPCKLTITGHVYIFSGFLFQGFGLGHGGRTLYNEVCPVMGSKTRSCRVRTVLVFLERGR